MHNITDQPDLELALRGRPADLQPLRVQVVAAGIQRHTRFPRRFLGILARRQALLWTVGATCGLMVLFLATSSPLLYTARISLEVTPPASANVVMRRATAGNVVEGSAQAVELSLLREYAQPRNLWERLTRTPSALPGQEEFLPELERHLAFTEVGGGRVVDIDFRSSDPARAAAFLDLLAQETIRTDNNARAESARQVRELHALPLAQARAELERSASSLAEAASSAGVLEGKQARFEGDADRLAQALDGARGRASTARPASWIQLEPKLRDFEAKRAIYDAASRKARDAEAEVTQSGMVRPLAAARLLPVPSRPNTLLIGLLGVLAGLVIGIPICLLRDATDPVIRDPADIPERTPIAPLGTIPHAALRRAARLGPGVPDLTGFPLFAPGSMESLREVRSESLSEAFRHVLASIWIAGQNNRRARVLLVTSPGAREGKTTAMVNLGIALANTRRRVLILDANMRRPQLHTMFGAPPTWGLANLLEGEQPVEDYAFEDLVFKTNIPGLYVLPAGSGHLSIAGMRHVDRLMELLSRFRLEFHAVLIDTPSGSDFPEARILARLADAVVLVLRAGRSRKDRVAAFARQLEDDGATVLGAVLNDYRNVH